jgi:hypothetical protein
MDGERSLSSPDDYPNPTREREIIGLFFKIRNPIATDQ